MIDRGATMTSRAGHLDAQPPGGRPAVDAVIRVGRVMHQRAALFDPGVDGVPWHFHVARCFGHRLTGQLGHLVGTKCKAERAIWPVNQHGQLGVDDDAPVFHRLDTPRMGLDIDRAGGDRRSEPAGWSTAERPSPGDHAHESRQYAWHGV